MDYEQLLAQYEDAWDTILELQFWELCRHNNRLQRTLSGRNSDGPAPEQIHITDGRTAPETSWLTPKVTPRDS